MKKYSFLLLVLLLTSCTDYMSWFQKSIYTITDGEEKLDATLAHIIEKYKHPLVLQDYEKQFINAFNFKSTSILSGKYMNLMEQNDLGSVQYTYEFTDNSINAQAVLKAVREDLDYYREVKLSATANFTYKNGVLSTYNQAGDVGLLKPQVALKVFDDKVIFIFPREDGSTKTSVYEKL